MSNALIYSPSFDGHRQVYLFVLSDILSKLGFKIFIAGNNQRVLSNSFYVDKLRNNSDIKFIDTSIYADEGFDITHDEFIAIQNENEIDLTIFAEADNHISLLVSQIKDKARFRGKLTGIFLRPFYYYEKLSLVDKIRYIKRLPSRWKKDEKLFFEFLLKRYKLLDTAFFIDEKYISDHEHFQWLPDVFQQSADLIVQDEKSGQRIWIEKLEEFKNKNKGKFMFFYFGTPQPRRGYDRLLKMAEDNDGCFVHCGLLDTSARFKYDVESYRSSLKQKGRLFETNEYIEDPACIEYFFKSVSHILLPYRNFFGSSGVMLQALSYGIPILTPEKGIIGYRTKKYKLGSTYNDKHESALDIQYKNFKELDPKLFDKNIEYYMSFQTAENLNKILFNTFNNSGESYIHP
jgi:hypothetical protein